MNREQNYYQILGVKPQATVKQIRSSFRYQAKRAHPDTASHHLYQRDNRRMRALIKAYRTLANPDLRREYDLVHGIDAHKFSFNFREFLQKRVEDYKSLARLVFHDLLHNRYAEAIDVYERYFDDALDKSVNRRSIRKYLSFYFSYSDYMDCLFLLAEAYEKKHQYLKAMRFYRNIARLESHKQTFGNFFYEVRAAIRRIIQLWERTARFQHITRFVPSLLDIQALRQDAAFYRSKIMRYKHLYRPDMRKILRQVLSSTMRAHRAVREMRA